jgi:hypothetical protein
MRLRILQVSIIVGCAVCVIIVGTLIGWTTESRRSRVAVKRLHDSIRNGSQYSAFVAAATPMKDIWFGCTEDAHPTYPPCRKFHVESWGVFGGRWGFSFEVDASGRIAAVGPFEYVD